MLAQIWFPKGNLPRPSTYLKLGVMAAIVAALSACGGGGGNTSSNAASGRVVLLNPLNGNAQVSLTGLGYSTPTTGTTETTSSGGITYQTGENITLFLGNNAPVTIPAKTSISQADIAAGLCAGSADPTGCQYNTKKNLESFFLTLDSDHNSGNGIQLLPVADTLSLAFTVSTDQFQDSLAQQLSSSGISVQQAFKPSLGINTEAGQSEQSTISPPVPYADIFRVARPFHEYSCKDATYDENGWPDALPASCTGKNPAVIRTFLLDSAIKGAVPDGKYIVLYEGNGVLEYSGYIKRIISHTQGRDEVEVELPAKLDSVATNNRIGLKVVSGTVKNIRIVMPGGICEGTPSVRVDDANGCPSGTYRSFADTFAANRNAIVFNPAYLNFLKDFRVVRMMNLMGSSPSYLTCAKPNPANPTNPNDFEKDADGKIVIDQTCLVQDLLWEQRSEMDDAVWGTSGNSFRMERYARGAPIEVQVELANQLNAHPWFNIPHNATEYYNRQFASYVASHLKPGLKAHIEYSNETWNGIFWAYHYMLKKGEELGNPTDAWRGANYYAKQASKVFQWWEDEFGGTQRLVRLLGTYQNDSNRTDRMLAYSDVKQYVDAVATGGYFYACWDRALAACQDTSKVPKPLVEATSVNDIFTAIDNPNDPFGMSGVNSQFQKQAAVASKYGKALLAYEGGQHLTLGTIAAERRQNMIDLMHAANRDPRMGDRYQQLLNSWKAAGGQTFTLFSVPHTFSQYGSFGIKESLLQARSSAPKYDGAMKFQETQGKCWWSGC
ncbi:MAG: hypothetical protein KJ914_06240 [Gammaproteobacteria bacterium]|nr:hypothetical protein [Gammaproteobacteria bacterium]MBU1725106.1 hypothetical protein [Gammaproteobacteria bacterium]MBU2004988.1 hypothetical protein [Gammaproteobacteria bacterium]